MADDMRMSFEMSCHWRVFVYLKDKQTNKQTNTHFKRGCPALKATTTTAAITTTTASTAAIAIGKLSSTA